MAILQVSGKNLSLNIIFFYKEVLDKKKKKKF